MPVTHGVAGSSPVRTARNKSLWFIVNQRLFYFNPRGRDSVENDLHLPKNETFQVKDGMKVMRLWSEYKNKKDLKDFLSSLFLWAVMDSNHRRRKPAELQSAPFGHSGNCPFWASCRIRTNDPEITNHVLWPTELKRHSFFISINLSWLRLQRYVLFFNMQ